MFSMASISPLAGQPALPMSLPSIQKAGHIPWPRGILMRASKRPYAWVKVWAVLSRAEVYLQAPYQQLRPAEEVRAVITRWPLPSSAALSVLLV
jgi:hypothetical protein